MDVDYSQNGEQHVILDVFEALGIDKGHLVDLGAGDGVTMSNSRALLNKGWTGDLYDGDPKGAKDVTQLWITRESVAGLSFDCDFLNIDIDGNDFHILRFMLDWIHERAHDYGDGAFPSLIVCEINPVFERNDAKVMPYNGSHVWQGDTYYGMSLAACEHLAAQYGYTLAYVHAGINAFLLRNDHVKAHPELIRPIEYRVKHDHKPHDPKLPWITL